MTSHRGLNQPDRLAWNSLADPTDFADAQSGRWTVPLNTPLLGVKKLQLIRATVPQATLNIPDYQLVFWYYKMPVGAQNPIAANLKCVRLFPSNFPFTSPGALGIVPQNSVMRFLQGGQADLVVLLNTAASPGGDAVALNPYWDGAVNQDVQFSQANGQILWQGRKAGFVYANAGWNDPNVLAAQAARNIVFPMYDATTRPQPQVQGFTLNQRIGYACSGTAPPPFAVAGSNPQFANSNGYPYAANVNVLPDAYPNLSGTSVVNVYGSFTGNSGNSANTTSNRKDLLAVIPMSGVLSNNNYNGVGMKAYHITVPREIYSIDIEFRDDQDQPYALPDNANVNLELSLMYED